MKNFFLLLLFIISLRGSSQNSSKQTNEKTYLPSALIDERFYLLIPTLNGDIISGFCDTGGGFTAIYNATIKKLNLEAKISEVEINGQKLKYIPAKEIIKSAVIPQPQIGNYYKSFIEFSFFEVPADDKEIEFFFKYIPHDVFLGQFYFMNQAWTFDYLAGKVFINTPVTLNSKDENTQVLGFKKDKSGNKRFGHPSMKIEIDGQMIDVLFDTGASLILGDSAKKVFGNSKKSTGGSFIAKSLFDKWHEQHPDWRIIEKGEITGADLIEVPQVKVGNLIAGPVWFAKRPDEVWSRGMIGSMDKIVKGAIGGSYLQYFKIQIDYNSELIRFEK